MNRRIYLDYAATAPMRREVLEAIFPFFQERFGNPSSVHGLGADAAIALETARDQIADVLGCLPDEVIFTSGGTESDNLALQGPAGAAPESRRHLVVSAVEHEAILQTASFLASQGFQVSTVPVDRDGLIHPEDVASVVRADTLLVSCMLANNEVGTMQDLAGISRAVKAVNPHVLVHTDAVQASAAIELNVDRLGVDLLSLSAHKIGGPRGIGVLYARRGVAMAPLLYGGGQERGARSGTENVAGAVGMATALVLAREERPVECRDWWRCGTGSSRSFERTAPMCASRVTHPNGCRGMPASRC